MTVQEEPAIPWRLVVVVLVLGLSWTVFWVVREHGRSLEPPTTDGTVAPPADVERQCRDLEAGRGGSLVRLIRTLHAADPAVRRIVLDRALRHALHVGGPSAYVPLLNEWRDGVTPALLVRLRPDEGGVAALEVFAALYLDVVGRRWRPEVPEAGLQAVYRLLVAGVDEPDVEPAQTVRTTAVGLVVRARDERALPALKRMLETERTTERRCELTRIIDSLHRQEP